MTNTEPDQDDIVVTDHVLSLEIAGDSKALWLARLLAALALAAMALGLILLANKVSDLYDEINSNPRIIVQCEIPKELGV